MVPPVSAAAHAATENNRPSPWSVRWTDGAIYPVGRWRSYTLVFFAASLCCTVTLKVGEIQYIELILALDFVLLALALLIRRPDLRIFAPFLQIAKSYGIFLGTAFALGIVALQQNFSAPHLTALKAPVIVTVARMAELFLDAFYMLYLASLFRTDQKLCRFGALTYFWTAIAGCLYSFITYPINVATGLQLGTYLDIHRMRGFNNEGGGFGVYLLSAILLAVVMYRRHWLSRRLFFIGLAIMLGGVAGSASKSAVLALAMLGLIIIAWFVTGWRRWAVFAVLSVTMIFLGSLVNIAEQLDMYRQASSRYQELSNLKAGDGNYVMGRVAGAVLAPRMIAARPLTGIGWGNYPLVRDNAEYRQGTAFEIGSVDSPALGVIDYIVELGIPLWLYLVWVEIKPVLMLRRARADVWLVALSLIQPVSNWTGAHLNLMHPWIIAAFALGLAYSTSVSAAPAPSIFRDRRLV